MTMSLARRTLLASGAVTLLPRRGRAADPSGLGEDAAIWGATLVQTGRYLRLSQARGVGFNRYYLNGGLATPASKLAGPNVDTIYGYSWLDLSKEPVLADVPVADDGRYYCLQFIDAYQNIIGYVGHRETGTRAGTYAVTGPGWSGMLPSGIGGRIESPTSLVRGDSDLAAARDFQLRYTLAPLSAWPDGRSSGVVQAEALNVFPVLDLSGDTATYLRELDGLVRRYRPVGQEVAAFEHLAPLGLGENLAAERIDPGALNRAIARINAAKLSDDNNGWRVNYHIRRFNPDPLARAAINRVGPGAHAAEEALYFTAASDHAGAKFDGTQLYRIVFPKGGVPPAGAFWSLILYDANLFLYDNPIHRYTINDRSRLMYAPDGSLPITVANKDPGDGSNWLPAPSGGFSLVLRTYEPDASLRNGIFRMPPITRDA